MNAYVLIQSDGSVALADRIRDLPGIVSAQDLTGPYDGIALARATDLEDVVATIRGVPGVTRALPAPLVGPPADGLPPAAPGGRAVASGRAA